MDGLNALFPLVHSVANPSVSHQAIIHSTYTRNSNCMTSLRVNTYITYWSPISQIPHEPSPRPDQPLRHSSSPTASTNGLLKTPWIPVCTTEWNLSTTSMITPFCRACVSSTLKAGPMPEGADQASVFLEAHTKASSLPASHTDNLTFLRDTRVGRMISVAPRGEERAEEELESEGEEDGPGPP